MRGYLLLVLPIVGACTGTDDSAYPSIDVEYQSAEIFLEGNQIGDIYIDATVSGPIRDGSPFTISDATVQTADWTVIDNLELTTGDQVWHDGATVHIVDTRHVSPANLLANCGQTVQIQFTLAVEMLDFEEVEGAGGVLDTPVVCY
jgi:hypothetical protein